MASARNHKKRSHRSEPYHRTAVAHMQKCMSWNFIAFFRGRYSSYDALV